MKGTSPLEEASGEESAYRFLRTLYDRSVGPALDPGKPNDGLNEGQRLIFNLFWFSVEVNNGGFTQYVWNSAGDHVVELVGHLGSLGQPELASAIRDFLGVVFRDGPPSRETKRRRSAMEAYFGSSPFNFDDDADRDLDAMPDPDRVTDLFYERETELMESVRKWAFRNPDFFG